LPSSSDPAVAAADRLVVAAVRLIRRLRAEDPAPRMTGPQASALAVVVHAGAVTLGDLAALEQVRRPTISRTAAELEALGLAVRETDARDRRVQRLRPTDKGRAWLAEGQSRRTAPLAAEIAALDPETRAGLETALPILERLARRTPDASQ
jgi:DNA-binding MarR family transcriptional regulator